MILVGFFEDSFENSQNFNFRGFRDSLKIKEILKENIPHLLSYNPIIIFFSIFSIKLIRFLFVDLGKRRNDSLLLDARMGWFGRHCRKPPSGQMATSSM